MDNQFGNYTSDELNELATETILGICWHDFGGLIFRALKQCVKCEQIFINRNVGELNMDFCRDFEKAFFLVTAIRRKIIEMAEKDEKFEFNYAAFSMRVKNECLLTKHAGNPQNIYHEEIFMLYSYITPRQIVEACLLGVNYEKFLK